MKPAFWQPRFLPLRRLILVGLVAQFSSFCFGALTWETRKIELLPQAEDPGATAVFRFRNDGREPVTITQVKASCGCTTAELAKLTYAPGETGELKSVFTFGGGTGPQEKVIQVFTSDAPAQPVSLILHANIPELFTYSIRLLVWRMAEEPVEQSVVITPLRPTSGFEVAPDALATVTTRVEPVESGKKYRIFIRPKSSAQSITTPVYFVARFADNTTRPLSIYVMVR